MNYTMKQLAVALAAATLVGGAGAASDNGTLTVNATVAGACAVGDSTLTFNVSPAVNADGTGSQSSADVTSSTTVSVVCTNGQDGTLSAGNGSNYEALVGRRLSSGGTTPAYIAYGLYTDSAHTSAFDSTGTMAISGTGTAETKTIYGKIAATDAAAAPKGSYSDSVTLTISYSL